MLEMFRKLIFPPRFEDSRRNRSARHLTNVLNLSLVLLVLLLLSGQNFLIVNITYAIIIIFIVGMRLLIQVGKVEIANIAFNLFAWASMTYLAWVGEGVRDLALITYLVFIFLASLSGNTALAVTLVALSISSIWSLFYAQTIGIFTPTPESLSTFSISITSVFLILSAILYFTIRELENALMESTENEKTLMRRNEELLQLQEELQENSLVLEKASEEAKHQAMRLQTIAKVSERIALQQNTNVLLPEITRLTSETFGVYHVGIFLISTDGKYAQLKAANSEGGQRMLARDHQLEIGRTGIVGQVAYNRTPRIILDVAEDATYFDNPDLPETHSEMALPLLYGDKLLGVLDVQSKRKSAFDDTDLEVFGALASQIAIAIENAYQLEQTQNALAEMEEVSRQYVRQEWAQLRQKRGRTGYRYLQGNVEKIIAKEAEQASSDEKATISVPVKLRDETIGVLKARLADGTHTWQDEDIELIQAVADRAALALDNARLLEDTSQRAGRERLVSEITTKIRSTRDPEVMLQTAMKELQAAFGARKIELTVDNKGMQQTDNGESDTKTD